MSPIKIAFLVEICLGIILILASFVIKKKFPKINWVPLLAAGITMILMGAGATIFFPK
jgi:hypothetical protein